MDNPSTDVKSEVTLLTPQNAPVSDRELQLKKLQHNVFSILLITCASVMVALGDLRNIITPLGYWLLWGVWTMFATISLLITKTNESNKQAPGVIVQKLLMAGFAFLLAGFMLSTIHNSDLNTLYQATKLLMICVIGILIHKHSARISHESIVNICLITVWISFGIFLASKHFLSPFHIVLGDGREGSLIAYPGVLWKTGAFFSIFALAHFLSNRKLTLGSILVFIIGLYIINSDGSRTGFLWIALATGMLIALRVLNHSQRYSLIGMITLGLFVLAVCTHLVYKAYTQGGGIDTLPLERLSAGDSVRSIMLHDGLIQAEGCLPLGCGFGNAVTETAAGPMVIHNAYMAIMADVGLIGLFGFLLIILGPFVAILYIQSKASETRLSKRSYITFTAGLGVAGFAFMMGLHPFSTEMSEWGLFFYNVFWDV